MTETGTAFRLTAGTCGIAWNYRDGHKSPQNRGEESASQLQQCACRTKSLGNLHNHKSTILDLSYKIHEGRTERQCENVQNQN